MSEKIQTIIFDYDGTLHDSMHIYVRAFNKGYELLVSEGLAPERAFGEADLAPFIGLTAEEAWNTFLPGLPEGAWQRAAAEVGVWMDRLIGQGEARLYPGATCALAALKDAGYQLVFLSNCRKRYQDVSREAFELDRYFSAYYNAEECGERPKEQIFNDIAAVFPGQYCVVGDRYKDLNIMRAHHLPGVGCTYGYGPLEEVKDADELASAPIEIVGAVKRIDARLRRRVQAE